MDPLTEKLFKNQLYEHFAGVCKAFGHPYRFQILELLAQGEFSVEELARETGVSVASVSQHLQTLRSAHLVQARREGSYAIYSLADDCIYDVLHAIRNLAERNIAEIDRLRARYLPQRLREEPVRFGELQEGLAQGRLMLLDVRSPAEYRAGHIPGALSTPLGELAERLPELPAQRPVVVYCRGPYSLLADRAVALLKDHGFAARRLEYGFPEWRYRGLPFTNCTN